MQYEHSGTDQDLRYAAEFREGLLTEADYDRLFGGSAT